MIKKIVIYLFFLVTSLVVNLMFNETIVRTKFFQEKFENHSNNPFINNIPNYLTSDDIENLKSRHQIELAQLHNLQSYVIVFISFISICIFALIALKPDFSVKKFDGFTVMSLYILLLFTLFVIFQIYSNGQFEFGNNAIIKIRTVTELILLLISPFIFYVTLKLNNFEIDKNMHHKKWLTNLAFLLIVLTGIIALIIGSALLFTVDVSSFKN